MLLPSQIEVNGWRALCVIVETPKMMDQVEQNTLEFIIWIGGNEGFCSVLGVIGSLVEEGKG